MERLLSVDEAADVLGLSRWTIRKWLSEKKINSVRLGRRVLFESAELNRLIEAGRQPAQTA
jgi:excisionase family DNA binding protein